MSRATLVLALLTLLGSATAFADPERDASLSWQLRPVTIGNVARVDTAAAGFNDRNGNLDLALTTAFTGSYQRSDRWAATVRMAFVGNNAPGAALDGSALASPLVGATYARARRSYRLAVFGGATIPVGTGNARTHLASMTARPADRAMFDVDHLAAIAGVDVAYVHRGFTAQGEATLVQSVSPTTRASLGLHLGYLIGWHVAVGVDLHYEDTLTASAGVRTQLRLGRQTYIRPGIALVRGLDSRGLDAPLRTAQTTAVMIDLPVSF